MTRYELATMKVGFGAVPKAAEAIAAFAAESGAGGRLLGCWFSDIGDLNNIAVLRGGDTGLEQRTDRRADQSPQDAQAADVRPRRPGPDRAPVPTRRMITKSGQEPVLWRAP